MGGGRVKDKYFIHFGFQIWSFTNIILKFLVEKEDVGLLASPPSKFTFVVGDLLMSFVV
jgi:hypothetical protein